jgi:hypothetical protein
LINKPLKILDMGCGCKNKANQAQQAQPVQTQQAQQGASTAQNNNNIQESVKKVINKYYRR